MKRITFFATSLAAWVLLAGTALAQDGSDLGAPNGPEECGIGGSAGTAGGVAGGSAFTGSEIAGLLVLASVLFAVGGAVFLLLRRQPAFDVDA